MAVHEHPRRRDIYLELVLNRLGWNACQMVTTDKLPGWEGASVHFHGRRRARILLITPHGIAHWVPGPMANAVLQSPGWVEAVNLLRSGE